MSSARPSVPIAPGEASPRRRLALVLFASTLLGLSAAGAWWLTDELQTSRLQAQRLAEFASELRYEVLPGASSTVRFPGAGPYDHRLGYNALPMFIERLTARDHRVQAQSHWSPRLGEVVDRGLFAPFHEKSQAGLELLDCRAEPLFVAKFPQRAYGRFDVVPPLVIEALLFIENRGLLDAQRPRLNPAFEWSRLARVATDQVWHWFDDNHARPGASTLATQIEKYRHSPGGRTEAISDKFRQMASASLRAYLDGETTLPRRRQIVTDYLDTVPLAARAGFGEVHGLGDAMWVWYGRDFADVNRLLADNGDVSPPSAELLARQALAFKQVLSLFIAQRRPSYYLGGSTSAQAELIRLTDSHLRLMADAGVIPLALRDAALPMPLAPNLHPATAESVSISTAYTERKAATALRSRLSGLLGVPRAYDLDRLDLQAHSTLDGRLQRAVSAQLHSLREPAGIKAAGLIGPYLLKEGDDPRPLVFSVTLYERGPDGNRLRVQTDNLDQPFDINDGARLDLGSTAKLRTLVTYLELVAEMHARWSALTPVALAQLTIDPRDALGRWGHEHLMHADDRSLPPMLDAAMSRRYSASPAETFFTGSGEHRFENFEAEDNHRVIDVREALTRSVNLVFIRLMRDVVQHLMFAPTGGAAALHAEADDPARRALLARFADDEGQVFLTRFYRQYQGRGPLDNESALLRGRRLTPALLASLFGELEPAGDAIALAAFVTRHLPDTSWSDVEWQSLHARYGGGRMSIADRGYVAGVHPLELWMAGWLRRQPLSTLAEALAASEAQRQAVYGWLFRTRHREAQDSRIRSLLEVDVFADIQRRWQRLGYPFDALTPSYATSIGSSGDRPAALAELMGIIANGGLRLPVTRIESLVFAGATPYETRMLHTPPAAERVLDAAVAATVQRALIGVVEDGTARRLKGAFARRDGTVVTVGAKTGTGDHRFDAYDRSGKVTSSRVVNRSASLVFQLGDRYFGTVVAYVHEPHAANYRFTSSLPAQLLKSLAPALQPLLDDNACR